MNHNEILNFYKSLLKKKINKEELGKLLDKKEPFMTDKKRNQYIQKLNSFIQEKEKGLMLLGFKVNEGKEYLMASSHGRASVKGTLTDKGRILKGSTNELDTLYKLKIILNQYPNKKIKKPYNKFKDYFPKGTTNNDLNKLTKAINQNTTLREICALLGALSQSQIIFIGNSPISYFIKSLCDFKKIKYKSGFKNTNKFLVDSNQYGYTYRDSNELIFESYTEIARELFPIR